ncbi:molybdopterin molybdotransferase MoeA [Geminicoccus roseus]|uniref:molybdopterin molybdotransferase MoeA n=1 Tax=Geminicoccus roseus TaxID=404900 RepID=UPI00040323EA|nr:gephyrin-like molybdotransferase Glp [Geminicoccus roseus]
MIPVEEARARLLAGLARKGTEWVALDDARGRVLAQDLIARRDQPPCAVSAMDGYAVRGADLAAPGAALRLIGRSVAGHGFDGEVAPGTTVRIFTGAPLPAGADAVALQEDATAEGDRITFAEAVAPGTFVRRQGLDFTTGSLALEAGAILGPLQLGLAATTGHAWLPVRRRPRAAILSTGDELVRPGETPGAAQIVSSNATTLAAMVQAWGGQPVDLGIVPDDREALAAAFAGLDDVDILLTSGGASVGEHDLVQEVATACGMKLDFWKIAMRPGKPLMVGSLGRTTMIGFPGNPVSSAVCAILFLRAALRTMLGLDPALPVRRLPLAGELGQNDRRQDYLRASLETLPDGAAAVRVTRRQDSSMFATLARADALVIRPPHAPPASPGELVEVILLPEVLGDLDRFPL